MPGRWVTDENAEKGSLDMWPLHRKTGWSAGRMTAGRYSTGFGLGRIGSEMVCQRWHEMGAAYASIVGAERAMDPDGCFANSSGVK